MPISDPRSTPNALTPQEMEVYVKQVLVPIIDEAKPIQTKGQIQR